MLRLANKALCELELAARATEKDIEIVAADTKPYGVADTKIIDSIQLLATREGLMADPVYEGRAIQGLLDLAHEGRFEKNANLLLMHLGGSPALHAYADQLGPVQLQPFDASRLMFSQRA